MTENHDLEKLLDRLIRDVRDREYLDGIARDRVSQEIGMVKAEILARCEK